MPQPVKAYVAHLDSLERENPVLLLVFAYHMHMAVCAGGAIIRKTARNAMGLPRDAGGLHAAAYVLSREQPHRRR